MYLEKISIPGWKFELGFPSLSRPKSLVITPASLPSDKIISDAANPGYISIPIASALVASHLHKDPSEIIKLPSLCITFGIKSFGRLYDFDSLRNLSSSLLTEVLTGQLLSLLQSSINSSKAVG